MPSVEDKGKGLGVDLDGPTKFRLCPGGAKEGRRFVFSEANLQLVFPSPGLSL